MDIVCLCFARQYVVNVVVYIYIYIYIYIDCRDGSGFVCFLEGFRNFHLRWYWHERD